MITTERGTQKREGGEGGPYQALEHSNICRSRKDKEPAKKMKASYITGKPGERDMRKGKPREESVSKRREYPFVSNTAEKMTSNCRRVII